MKLSKKCKYAIKSIVYLANKNATKDNPISVREIAENNDISEKFLEHIFRDLKKQNLVESVRGANGGYYLTKSPEDISLLDVMFPFEKLGVGECDDPNCSNRKRCEVFKVRSKIDETLQRILDNMAISNIL